mmetsp:Transcript_33492/g.70419  ORF Transcript_33492/g.70419 Transcript_33492/m.70419 type:complete len:235 (-) Transcript_33492:1119-1823(-)
MMQFGWLAFRGGNGENFKDLVFCCEFGVLYGFVGVVPAKQFPAALLLWQSVRFCPMMRVMKPNVHDLQQCLSTGQQVHGQGDHDGNAAAYSAKQEEIIINVNCAVFLSSCHGNVEQYIALRLRSAIRIPSQSERVHEQEARPNGIPGQVLHPSSRWLRERILNGNDIKMTKEGACHDRKGEEQIMRGGYLEELHLKQIVVFFIDVISIGTIVVIMVPILLHLHLRVTAVTESDA